MFSKVKARIGLDRVRIMLTGSAPIAPHVLDFLRAVFGCVFDARFRGKGGGGAFDASRLCCNGASFSSFCDVCVVLCAVVDLSGWMWRSCLVLEGYGQTECSAAATLSSIMDVKTFGHVGGPLACNEIKLVSVEDMGYRYDDKFHMRVLDKVRGGRAGTSGRPSLVFLTHTHTVTSSHACTVQWYTVETVIAWSRRARVCSVQDGKVISPGDPCDGRGEVCYRGFNVFPGYDCVRRVCGRCRGV